MQAVRIGALAVVLCAPSLAAQGGTEIWVASLSERGSTITVGRPVNVTKRPGYDNQPAFTRDGAAVLFTSIREDAQADIWRVAIDGSAPQRLTTTSESEYSATLMPSGNGFSVIRVERDSTQRLWEFAWDGSATRVILPGLKPVGYHVWVGEGAIGAFVLRDPTVPEDLNALVLADPRTERVDTLARGIGRAFARVPGRDAFTFVHFHGDTSVIGEVDVRTGGVRRITHPPTGGEYHVWTQGGRLIASSGPRLYLWIDGRWDVIAELAVFGVRNITRLALSPAGDRIAFVSDEPPAP